MQTHYIPRLLLKQFASDGKVNSYDFEKQEISKKKLKNTFAETDLYPSDIEEAFATRMEGPFGDLLNHKLLSGDTITINRKENLLIRKFLLLHYLRAPITNCSREEMIKRTRIENHPSTKISDYLLQNSPEFKEMYKDNIPSNKSYISDIRKALEIESLEDISDSDAREDVSPSLKLAARNAMVPAIAYWDCSESGQEFILPKLPGISQMDYRGMLYKFHTLLNRKEEIEREWMPEDLAKEFSRLLFSCGFFSDNFSLFPLSSTRVLVCFHPYFRAFFPIDIGGMNFKYPPLFHKTQFDAHFYKPMRMELFKPCVTRDNRNYQYEVKNITYDEVMELNALLLEMETEEFVFRNYNGIQDSLKYYDTKAEFAFGKKNDFSHLY